MSLTVKRVDPLTMGDQIKALFTANERPDFPDWYDRAYPVAVQEGAASWVSLDPGGRVVAHVAGFWARLANRGTETKGGLLCNLMADKEHRTFFPVVAVIKRAVKDMREAGAEFLYTNPINPGSVATMRAAGLLPVGLQNRYLMPLGHGNLAFDAVAAANLRIRRSLFPPLRAEIQDVSLAVRWTVDELAEVSEVTARRMPTVYHMRWENFGTGLDVGIGLFDARGEQVGAAVVRAPEGAHEGTLITLRCRKLAHVSAGASAVGALLRARGLHRLNTVALMGTDFANQLRRAGFVERKEPWTIVGVGFTEAGRSAIAGLGSSDLEKIDVD